MKNIKWIYPLAIMGVFLILTNSCEKDNDSTPTNIVTDIDGNIYHTVTIGTQVWMVENLNVTHYRNGDPITNITDNTQWFNLTTEAYCDYTGYGRIYNSYAVQDSRNIAPTGWHVPSDAEWTTLSNYLINEGYGYEGSGPDIAKSMASTSDWDAFSDAGTTGNNQASNNSSGFTALPGGGRFTSGAFYDEGRSAYWLSSTDASPTSTWSRGIDYNGSAFGRGYYDKDDGLSVRCLKD